MIFSRSMSEDDNLVSSLGDVHSVPNDTGYMSSTNYLEMESEMANF